jgi:hypothetical protein
MRTRRFGFVVYGLVALLVGTQAPEWLRIRHSDANPTGPIHVYVAMPRTEEADGPSGDEAPAAWCSVDRLPAIIAAPGRYRFRTDLSFSESTGAAIDIQCDDVTLDLNGHRLVGTSADPTRATFGIHAERRNRITIRNGAIEGFYTAVMIRDELDEERRIHTGWHVLEQLSIRDSTFCGVRMKGRQSVIRDCLVVRTGGTTLHEKPRLFGIDLTGPQNLVTRSQVIDTFAPGSSEVVGIGIAEAGVATVISKCIVRNVATGPIRTVAPDAGHALSIGIWVGGESIAACRGNTVEAMRWGVAGSSEMALSVVGNTFVDCGISQAICGWRRGEVPAPLAVNIAWFERDNVVRRNELRP